MSIRGNTSIQAVLKGLGVYMAKTYSVRYCGADGVDLWHVVALSGDVVVKEYDPHTEKQAAQGQARLLRQARRVYADMGVKGGAVKSRKKTRSSRVNGLKGGRPKTGAI